MNLLIVTPLFPPAVGGAATYYQLLTRHLLEADIVRTTVLVTEKCTGRPGIERFHDGRLIVYRIFPERAGRDRERFVQYPKYLMQNLKYFRIPALCARYSIDTLLVHGGLHNRFNALWLAQRLAARRGVSSIADIRDVQLPKGHFHQLEHYDRIICCAAVVARHIGQQPQLAGKVTLIPVIQERILRPDVAEVTKVIRRHGLEDRPFLLHIGVVRREKGIDDLLRIFSQVRKRHPDLHLVLAGNVRDRGELGAVVRRTKGVHAIGPVSRQEVFALLSACRAAINISPSEGVPRSSLEAMALGVPVILPPNIPEFMEYCPDAVHDPSDLSRTVRMLDEIIESARRCSYPIENHYPEHVIPHYAKLLCTVLQGTTR